MTEKLKVLQFFYLPHYHYIRRFIVFSVIVGIMGWDNLPTSFLMLLGGKFPAPSVEMQCMILTSKSWAEALISGVTQVSITGKISPRLCNIRRLEWNMPPLDPIELAEVSLGNLQHISLKFDDDIFMEYPEASHLKRKLMENLFNSNLSSLESLDLKSLYMYPHDISESPGSTRIYSVNDMIPSISKIENLTYLNLSSRELSNENLDKLSLLTRLTTLELKFSNVTDECLPMLPKSLTSLDLSCCINMKFEKEAVLKMPRVTTLKLTEFLFERPNLENLPTSLTFLDLSDNPGLKLNGCLFHLTYLRTLILKYAFSISDECIETLPPSIMYLDVSYCDIKLSGNVNLPMLRTLDLSGNFDIKGPSTNLLRLSRRFRFLPFQSLTHVYFRKFEDPSYEEYVGRDIRQYNELVDIFNTGVISVIDGPFCMTD